MCYNSIRFRKICNSLTIKILKSLALLMEFTRVIYFKDIKF